MPYQIFGEETISLSKLDRAILEAKALVRRIGGTPDNCVEIEDIFIELVNWPKNKDNDIKDNEEVKI